MRISDWSSDVCSSDLDFAPEHAGDIRTLAHEGYWDGMSINRSQDNFVVQWGDTAEEGQLRKSLGSAKTQLPAEFERPAAGLDFHALPDKETVAAILDHPDIQAVGLVGSKIGRAQV